MLNMPVNFMSIGFLVADLVMLVIEIDFVFSTLAIEIDFVFSKKQIVITYIIYSILRSNFSMNYHKMKLTTRGVSQKHIPS